MSDNDYINAALQEYVGSGIPGAGLCRYINEWALFRFTLVPKKDFPQTVPVFTEPTLSYRNLELNRRLEKVGKLAAAVLG